MEIVKSFMFVAFCLNVLTVMHPVNGKVQKKFSEAQHGKGGGLSEETILFRDKLNLLLDAESKEVNLLKNLLDEEHEKEELESDDREVTLTTQATTETVSASGKAGGISHLRELGIVTKLEENSKRMEKMVVFLVDLRNLLTEALTEQNRQMAVESEMVEMREEMEYLRKELHSLKKEEQDNKQKVSDGNVPSLQNQLHNDHTTLEWLKSSTHELRNQITELSDQCNVTLLMSLRGRLESEAKRRDDSLRVAEKQIEILRLGQMQQREEIKDVKSEIQDLRSWQVKMGNKVAAQMDSSTESNSVEEMEEERNFITEALKDAVGKPGMRHQQQSHKRLKSKVHQLQQLVEDLQNGNKNHERRLDKLETSQRTLKSLISSTSGGRVRRNLDSQSHHSISVQSLEKTMQEYLLTLEQLNDKVSGMDELQESTTQLFRTLEQLEKKYDDRVGEIQTGLARLESGVSTVLVTNEDLKEQQTQQSSVIQAVKKDLFQVKGKLQTNHLRLAAVQSQMLKWASAKCSDENSESIQNIRIATLEHALLDSNSHNDRRDDSSLMR